MPVLQLEPPRLEQTVLGYLLLGFLESLVQEVVQVLAQVLAL
jgi:hypothetical protein